jgi:hypothetical protein
MASETYEFLKNIAEGKEYNRWSYPDELIYNISQSKGKSPKIEIAFDNDDDFLEVLGVTDDTDIWVWRRYVSPRYGGNDFDMWRYDEDWREGYIIDAFKDENITLANKILSLTNPTLQIEPNVSNVEIAKFLENNFDDECDDIKYEYGRYHEECIERAISKELVSETENPFINFGIVQKQHGYKFQTSVNILLNLYKMLQAQDEDLKGMLKLLMEKYSNNSVGDWSEMEYNSWCDDYDDESFQKDVTRNLEKMLETVEESFEDFDYEEYNKMYEKVMSIGGFNKYIKLPEKNMDIMFHKFKPNNKLFFVVYKNGGNKGEERSVDNLEDLNLQLHHPELFESIRNIFKKLL